MADVFVSYAHANRSRVEKICEGLSQGGLDVWWDERLRPGEVYQLVIEQAIHDSKSAVVAWSSEARNSLWVLAEANRALDENKLAQVRLDGVKLPLPFNAVHIVDLSHWRGGREAAPFPDVEAAARAIAGGQQPALEPRVFKGPPLQTMGSAAMLGWFALALVYVQAALMYLAGPGGPLRAEDYRIFTFACFVLACATALLTLVGLVRTALASRVRT